MATALSTVLTNARAFAGTDANGINSTNGIAWANDGVLDIRTQLCAMNIDAGVVQETYADAQATIGTYNYPSDFLALKMMEVNLVSTNAQDYKVAKKLDAANPPAPLSLDWLRLNQPSDSPMVNDHGSWYEILPTPTAAMNLTKAIRFFYWLMPTAFTATTDTLGWPENINSNCLSHYIAARYYQSVHKDDKAQVEMGEFARLFNQIVNFIKRGGATPLQTSQVQISGWEF